MLNMMLISIMKKFAAAKNIKVVLTRLINIINTFEQ